MKATTSRAVRSTGLVRRWCRHIVWMRWAPSEKYGWTLKPSKPGWLLPLVGMPWKMCPMCGAKRPTPNDELCGGGPKGGSNAR